MRFLDRCAQCGQALGVGHSRQVAADQSNRRLFENTGWFASARIFDDDSIRRIRRLPGNAGQPERGRVHPHRMTVITQQLRGTIGDDRIELLTSRQSAWL
jgi:hypothetical protein